MRAKGITRARVIMGLDLKVCSPAWKTCMRTGQVRPRPTPNTHLISTRSGYQRRRRSLVVTYDMRPGSGKPRRGAGDGWLQAGFQPAAGGPTEMTAARRRSNIRVLTFVHYRWRDLGRCVGILGTFELSLAHTLSPRIFSLVF